jgi:signal transduction histidine kinase
MQKRSLTMKSIVFLVLVCLGIAGTRFSVGLFFGVDFVFGSIATFIILIAFGRRAAILAAVLIGSYTIGLWGHYYAFLALVAEAALVSAILKRARYNLTLATGFYWLVFGIPFVFFCYFFMIDLPWDRALLVATKQAINEIFNAVVASLILEHTAVSKIPGLEVRRNRSVFQTIFNIFVAAAIIPSFAILVLDSRQVAAQIEQSVELRLETISSSLSLFSERWKDQHISTVELIARMAENMRDPTPARLQKLVQQFRKSSPDLRTIYISDPIGKTIAFDPAFNAKGESTIGLDFSDRDYFNVLKNKVHQTEVSSGILARGGANTPVITVNASIFHHDKFAGIVSSALNLERLTNVLNHTGNDTHYFATIVDREGRVVSSNNPMIHPLDPFTDLELDPSVTHGERNFYQRWPPDKRVSPMLRWSRSSLGMVSPLHQQGEWKLYVEIPLVDQYDNVFHQYGRAIGMLMILILFILAASHWLASLISDPLSKLSTQTTNLPARLSSPKKSLTDLFWPKSEFQEVRILVDNFEAMNIELKKRFQELEFANRIKDEFLATLSHELRTPLNVITGHSEVIKGQLADLSHANSEQLHRSIDAISRNAAIQNQLVSDLLDISAIISGKIAFQPKLVSLNDLAHSVIEGIRLSAEAKGVKLSVSVPETSCSVLGDSTRLHQVIWNLLSNAIKFTPRGGTVELKIIRQINGSESFCVIEVSDNGRGIEAEFLPYLFERFSQEDSTTTRKFGGLGLGLSIVRTIVELHGGTAQATSEGKGLGSLFRVILPFSDIAPSSEALVVTNQATEEHLAFNLESRRANSLTGVSLLVIDDDIDSRELMDLVLSEVGAKVTTVANATDALLKARSEHFDAIVSDIGLPDQDGYSLIKQLRSDTTSVSQKTSAIALTAYARDEDRQRCLDAGFQSYLSKPVDVPKLIQMILDLLKI